MEYKWPHEYADLHKISDRNTITLNNKDNVDILFYEYAKKFKNSSTVIVDRMLSKPDIFTLDMCFFSIAYLYRHSIELLLKAIGFQFIEENQDRSTFIKSTHHNLFELFCSVESIVVSTKGADIEASNWIKEFLDDASCFDKRSDSFRYPFSIQVEKDILGDKRYMMEPVFERQTHIDLIVFANKFEIIFECLDSIFNGEFIIDKTYKEYSSAFIQEGGEYYSQSVVGYGYSKMEHYPYVTSYYETAKILYDLIIKNIEKADLYFLPMCYLLRNSVELSIKQLLFEECSFSKQESLRIFNKHKHSVLSLWNAIKNEVKEHSNAPEDDESIKNVSFYIEQLHELDSSSDKFRYPTTKNMQIHFKKVKKFDIVNVSVFFEELLNFIRAVTGMISAHNEWKREMDAEMSNWEY